jgi:hypothetical protein
MGGRGLRSPENVTLMAESQAPYSYSNNASTRISGSLSQARLGKYLSHTAFDFPLAMDFYLWNARLSKALLYVIQVVEVTLRNAVDEQIRLLGGPTEWAFDPAFLGKLDHLGNGYRESLNRAKERLLKNKLSDSDFNRHVINRTTPHVPNMGVISTNDVIAKLPFEFWVVMLGHEHENDWQMALRQVFPHIPKTVYRSGLWRTALEIKIIRNRISHHEPIFHLTGLVDKYRDMLAVVDWRCAETGTWLRHHATFMKTWHDMPRKDRAPSGKKLLDFAHAAAVIEDATLPVSDMIPRMKGKKRDFVLVRQDDDLRLITSDDVSRWMALATDVGLVDLSTTIASFMDKVTLTSRVAFAGEDATSGMGRALFSPKDTPNKNKPTAVVITSDGTEAGVPKGVVFKPDFGV